MVAQSWFRNLWSTSKKPDFRSEKAKITVLSFEAGSLMSKLHNLWQCLTDKQVARLRDEITNSVGIKKLVSENDDYIGNLICTEITENLMHVARALARLSKKCDDPLLKSFERAFDDLVKSGSDAFGWQFSWKKMERKTKKMQRFIVANANLYNEMVTLADLEQSLKRLKGNDNVDSVMLVEYEKKVVWKKQEVKRLKENSLWSRTYDYTVLLLVRAVFTVYGRIGHVFGSNHIADVAVKGSSNSRLSRSTVFMQSSVYPSENCVSSGQSGKSVSLSGPLLRMHNAVSFHSGPNGNSGPTSSPISGRHNGVGFYSGPLSKSTNKPGPLLTTNNAVNFHSGPLGNSMPTSSLVSGKHNDVSFYSGPLSKLANKHGPFSRANKSALRLWHSLEKSIDPIQKNVQRKPNGITGVNGNSSDETLFIVASRSKVLNPPPDTLGASALALHYANLIIFIEKLASSPDLIGNDVRDDLYNMLLSTIRSSLRAKLKPYAKSLSYSVYDTTLVREWNEAMLKTLEWLAPLAHNMMRWQSERSFEHQSLVSRTNVLLVQTLYFANQEKTESEITELLVGLNYVWRFSQEINAKPLVECA